MLGTYLVLASEAPKNSKHDDYSLEKSSDLLILLEPTNNTAEQALRLLVRHIIQKSPKVLYYRALI